MKSIILYLTAAFVLLFQMRAGAQSGQYNGSVKEQIKQVENNFFPRVYTDGDKPMTIVERMLFYKVKGMSVAVIHNYKLVWAKGYGMADDSMQRPVTVHTLFQAGSVSKSLNAVGVLKLVQDKKIDIYADINNYLRSWKFTYDSISQNKKISVINLLSHSGGINIHGFPGYQRGRPVPTVLQVLNGEKPANTPRIRPLHTPGVKFEYSGGGITISQLIAMDVTNQPYDKYMYNAVLKPLRMTASTYEQPPLQVNQALLATGYYTNGKQVQGKYHIYPEQAAAGLWTNPTDLAKFIIETQLAYQGKSAKVLNRQTVQLQLTPYLDKSAALGVFIDDFDGTKYFEHSGSDVGFQSHYFGSMAGGDGVVVMVNSDGGSIMEEVVNSIARVYNFKGLDLSKKIKHVVVPDAVLQTYTGKYEVAPGTILTITREGNQLYGQPTGQTKLALLPESENKFIVKDFIIELEFIKNDKGEITKAILYQNGTTEAKKIE